MKRPALALIRFYKRAISPGLPPSCRFQPTCSEYAYEAIARHGLWAGGFMGLFRLARCGPGGTHGIDLVPERLPERYVWHMPWRYWAISSKDARNDSG